VDGVPFTWDANGNLLDDGTNAYTYDAANRLVSTDNGSSTILYSYNGLGDRYQQEVMGGATATYVLDLNTDLPVVLSDDDNTYLYGLGNIAQVNAAETSYFLGDALGSTRQLTDYSGDVVLSQAYDPFGNVTSLNGTTGTIFTYTGQQADPNNLIYLRARYYDPSLGRFLNRDTFAGYAGLSQSQNRYSYTGNNPVNYTDPSGNCPWCIMGGIALIGGLAVGGSNLALQLEKNGGLIECVDWAQVALAFGAGAIATLAVEFVLVTAPTPDSLIDAAFVFFDASTGAWGAFGLDMAGLALPGVTGLGHYDDAYHLLNGLDNLEGTAILLNRANDLENLGDVARELNYMEDSSDLFKSLDFGAENSSSLKHYFSDLGLDLKDYTPSRKIFGQEKDFSCVAASCKMILNDPSISEETIRGLLAAENHGTSLSNAVNILENYKYVNDATYSQLLEGLENGPAIVSVNKNLGTGTNHAIVVDAHEVDSNGRHWLSIRDPLPRGEGAAYKISVGDFWDFWMKERGIVIVK
jgi:RHS repeat-associated protein